MKAQEKKRSEEKRREEKVREFEVATRLVYVVARAQPYKLSPALYYNSTRIDVDTAQ